jgi:hypothetical protein
MRNLGITRWPCSQQVRAAVHRGRHEAYTNVRSIQSARPVCKQTDSENRPQAAQIHAVAHRGGKMLGETVLKLKAKADE